MGIALNLVASGLVIQQACSVGREEECTEAKYVEGSKLGASIVGGIMGGGAGTMAAIAVCSVGLGVVTGGFGIFACIIIGSGLGGYAGDLVGSYGGEIIDEYL